MKRKRNSSGIKEDEKTKHRVGVEKPMRDKSGRQNDARDKKSDVCVDKTTTESEQDELTRR